MIQESMSLTYEPSSEPLRISAKQLFLKWLFLRASNFHHAQLNGSLPDTLSQLKKLRHLGVWQNQLSGDIPASLSEVDPIGTHVGARLGVAA